MDGWNPTDPDAWARLLGLIAVPMFGTTRARTIPGKHSLMLDGAVGSFLLSIPESSAATRFDPNRWSWSANVTHSVTIEADAKHAIVRRWDAPQDSTRVSIARKQDARRLFLSVEESQLPPDRETVIARGLTTFRAIRTAIEKQGGSSVDVIIAFNTVLALVAIYGDRTRRLQVPFLEALRETGLANREIARQLHAYPIGDLARLLWEGTPGESPYLLDADLLIRHASGQLCEEAHRQLLAPVQTERQGELFPTEMLLIGPRHPHAAPPSDVHSTPPSLARALVELALHFFSDQDPRSIDVLDPACGSGVFLIEMLREATLRGSTTVNVRGFDISLLAIEMSTFCVGQATHEIRNGQRTIEITKADALTVDWGRPDIIVTNPPFISWENLDGRKRHEVARVLGAFHRGRQDIAFAFVMKALDSLKPGGVLACIVPHAFFELRSAEVVRRYITASGEYQLRAIGQFKDFSYFNASVQPSFIVVSRVRTSPTTPIRIITADAGCAERAIRAIRTLTWEQEWTGADYQLYNILSSELSPRRWTPISQKLRHFVGALEVNTHTTVSDFFVPQLGARTGNKSVFLISDEEVGRLCTRKSERAFFRPVADRISRGRIQPSGYVFYPYDEEGSLLLQTEQAVARALPTFYQERLKPAEGELKARSMYRNWWELTRPVATWLAARVPRLLSQTYGRAGNFAFDENGTYAVVQGVGWRWKAGIPDKNVMLAYLALLNSRVFDDVLRAFCRQIEGGYSDLTQQFIEHVPLPDLATAGAVTDGLTRIGRAFFRGRQLDQEEQHRLSCEAYGVSTSGAPLAGHRGATNVEREFRRLADHWEAETGIYSRVRQKTSHPSYRKIIALGKEVLPILLREMRDSPNYWSDALRELTGANPVPDQAKGLNDVAKAWVEWARNSGYDV